MDEALYATLGRKQLELEQLHAEYDRLLVLLAEVVEGRMPRERVQVNLDGRCWAILAAEQDAASGVGIPNHVNGAS